MENKMTFKVSAWESDDGVVEGIEFTAYPKTREEAIQLAAQFPKYLKLRATGCQHYENGKEWNTGMIHLNASLVCDGVNKGVNEAGLKRARKFAALVNLEYTKPYGNSISADRIKTLLEVK